MQSREYFIFPYKFEDILEKSSDKRFTITSANMVQKMDDRRIEKHLLHLEEALLEDRNMINEEDRFSFLFYLIDKVGFQSGHSTSGQSLKHLEKIFDLLNSYFFQLLKTIINQQNNQRYNEMKELRICFKMSIFLLFKLLQNSCIRKQKSLLDNVDKSANDGDNSKKSKKQTQAQLDEYTEKKIFDNQIQSLKLLQDSLQDVDLIELWERKLIDEAFYKYYLDTCLKMLESKIIAKDQNSRQSIFKILNYVLKELQKEETNQLQWKIINLIYEDETIVGPIADYIRNLSKGNNLIGINFTQELLQLMVMYLQDKTNVQTESLMFKNSRQFFSILSDIIPEIFYNNLSIFLSLLESDAYILRNCVYDIILNVMKHVLMDIDEENESKQKTKENLINILIQRINDKNAFCRSQVLQNLAECCSLNLIPIDYLKILLKQAIERTKDVGSIVRKRALALIQKIVDFYSYIFAKNAKFLTIRDIQRELQMSQEQIEIQDEKITEIDQKIQQLTQMGIGSQNQKTNNDDNEIIIDEEKQENNGQQNQNQQQQKQSRVDSLRTEGQSDDEYLDKLMIFREEISKRIVQIQEKNRKLLEYSNFIEVVDILVPNLVQMLGSKNTGDVLETIRLLTQLKRFNIESAQKGMRKMLVLVFSQEKTIKEEVLNTYHSLYMDQKQFKNKKIAQNLINLLKNANLTEEKSFEEMVFSMLETDDKKKELSSDVFREAFDIFNVNFAKAYDNVDIKKSDLFESEQEDEEENEHEKFMANLENRNNDNYMQQQERENLIEELRAALKIIRIGLYKRKKIVQKKQLLSFQNNLKRFLALKGKLDWIIVKEISSILEQCKQDNNNIQLIIDIIKLLILLLIQNHGTRNNEWYIATTQIIKLTFQIQNNPEGLIRFLLNSVSKFISEGNQNVKKNLRNNKRSAKKTPIIQKAEQENENLEQELEEIIEENKEENLKQEQSKIDQEEIQQEDQEKEQNLNKKIRKQNEIYENKLAQSIFLASESCIRFLIHADNIEDFLTKMREQIENRDVNKKQQNSEEIEEEEEQKTSKSKKKSKKGKKQEEQEEDELEQINGGTEADHDERVRNLQKIMEGFLDDSQIFRFYKGLTKNICQDLLNNLKSEQKQVRNVALDRVVVLSLIKFMCISYKFCRENISYLFQLIDPKAPFANELDNVIKTNILVGLGDLYRRYTNLLEPYLPLVYQTLQDKNNLVRKTSLMVITHLVLIDKLKVKAEVSNIATLIQDPHQPIQNQVKLFFYEINKKDVKQIYNFLPDIITNLSKPEVNDEIFTEFAKQVLTTVIKETPNEQMIEKMIQRFELTSTLKEWRNISTVLTLFQYNDKSIKRLLEKFEFFRQKLQDEKILENFQAIIKKTKLFGTKTPEIKALIEEFEAKVNNYKKETFDDYKYKKEKKPTKKDTKNKKQQQQKQRKSQQIEMVLESDDSDEYKSRPRRKSSQQMQQRIINQYSGQQQQNIKHSSRNQNRGRQVIIESDSD